jgi:hypothetical protein
MVQGGGKGVTEGVELTEEKYAHSEDTFRNPLNIDFKINNERQDCKIGTVCVCVWGVLVGGGG